jgi:hypothetical protein
MKVTLQQLEALEGGYFPQATTRGKEAQAVFAPFEAVLKKIVVIGLAYAVPITLAMMIVTSGLMYRKVWLAAHVHHVDRGVPSRSFDVDDIQSVDAIPLRVQINGVGEYRPYEPGSVTRPGALKKLPQDAATVKFMSPDKSFDVTLKRIIPK